MKTKTVALSDVVFRDDLYPRVEHNQQKAQEYSQIIELLPPIELNQHNELIDGRHRCIAHQLDERKEIVAIITETRSDEHLLELAIQTNASHGLQLSQADKRKMAIRLYAVGDRTPERKKELAELLSVSPRTLQSWVSDLDQAEREARKETIRKMWLQCYTAEEIGEAVGLSGRAVEKDYVCELLEDLPKVPKATYSEPGWSAPIYNVWSFGKKTNATSHFGNTEQRIVDNLLWLYTAPGDIVLDPFGGGGSTLDVCQSRGRRCWISDRKPKAGLEEKVRKLNICEDTPSLNKRWSDVSLTYLDPPYWRQAAGEYSDDAEDLANMPLELFTENMVSIIRRIGEKQKTGHIAMIIQPTQWRSEPKGAFSDHIFDIAAGVSKFKRFTLENRISCPYSTEQCTPQMVNWAKENKKPLVLSRELVIWKLS